MTPTTQQPIPAMFEAGFAEQIITPPVGTPLAGFFHNRVSVRVRDDLHARAMVLSDGRTRVAIISLELICVDSDFVDKAEPEISPRLSVLVRQVDIPYYTRTPELMAEVAELKRRTDLNAAEAYLVRAVEEWPFDGKVCQVPMQVIRVADLAIVAVPAQIFTQIALEMKRWSPAAHTMIVELCNARVTSYVPTADQVERGAYGSRPVVSRWLSTDTGRRMIDAVLVMLQELWSDS